jgi:hypothetical protein
MIFSGERRLIMNTRLLRRIIQLLLAALLLTGILLLAGGTAAAQTRVQRRVISCSPNPSVPVV